MSRMLELCQGPECFARDSARHEVFHIIPYLVISHWAFYNVIVMYHTVSASNHEIKPFIRHTIK